MKRHLILVLALLMLGIGPLVSQSEEFDETVDVTEVLLDVLVTDSDGRVILGLTAEDFEVEEAGRAVDLSSAVFYSNRPFRGPEEKAEEAGVTPDEQPSDRFFVLFFHDQTQGLSALTSRQLDAGRRSKAWIKSELTPTDQVAVVSYDVKLKIHQDFTDDRAALLTAVDNAIKRVDPGDNWPSRQEKIDSPTLLTRLPQGKDLRKETGRLEKAMVVFAECPGRFCGSQERHPLQHRVRRCGRPGSLPTGSALLSPDDGSAQQQQRGGLRHRSRPHQPGRRGRGTNPEQLPECPGNGHRRQLLHQFHQLRDASAEDRRRQWRVLPAVLFEPTPSG